MIQVCLPVLFDKTWQLQFDTKIGAYGGHQLIKHLTIIDQLYIVICQSFRLYYNSANILGDKRGRVH